VHVHVHVHVHVYVNVYMHVYVCARDQLSDEVKRELPRDAEVFATVDVRIRALTAEFVRTARVLQCCTPDGVHARIQAVNEDLERCKKSLADFLDGKRRLFPRFYFVSEADLLDILSKGSHPAAIMHHLSKVLLATEALTIADGTTATEFIAGVGNEVVQFEPTGVELVGRVEEYLTKVLNGIMLTLQRAMKASYKRYGRNRTEWLLAKLAPKLGRDPQCVDPAQIAVLVAAIKFVEEVEAAFNRLASGSGTAMAVRLRQSSSPPPPPTPFPARTPLLPFPHPRTCHGLMCTSLACARL
jgi:dynein heavy chain